MSFVHQSKASTSQLRSVAPQYCLRRSNALLSFVQLQSGHPSRRGERLVGPFLRPFSTGLWTAITIYAVVMALALKIYFEVGLAQGKEEPRDQTLQDRLLATFRAVFCSQGRDKSGPDLMFFELCIIGKRLFSCERRRTLPFAL